MDKINRLFGRIILEETSINVENFNKAIYAYGVSHENDLFFPSTEPMFLVSHFEYAQILSKNRTTNKNKMGVSEIPTVISGKIKDAAIAIWDENALNKFGRLYPENISMPENVDPAVLSHFSDYDGLYDNMGIEPRVYLFDGDKFFANRYSFYLAGKGWTRFMEKDNALAYLNELFVVKNSGQYFNF